jgi:hypothetical protein
MKTKHKKHLRNTKKIFFGILTFVGIYIAILGIMALFNLQQTAFTGENTVSQLQNTLTNFQYFLGAVISAGVQGASMIYQRRKK